MNEKIDNIIAMLEKRAPEMRERAERVLDEQLAAYQEHLGFSDEGASFLKEKIYFRLASENIPSLLEDLEKHLGSEGVEELISNPKPLDVASRLSRQGNPVGALLVQEYADFATCSFEYCQPDKLDPFGGIIIGLQGENWEEDYFRFGIAAELAHHLVFCLRPEDEVHGGIDEFYDCALSSSVLPDDLKEERLRHSAFSLRMKHLAASYLEKAGNPKDAAAMVADAWITELKKNYSSLESPSIHDRFGNIITKTPFFRWRLQSALRSDFEDVSEKISPEHLMAYSFTWQVLDGIMEITGYSIEKSFDMLPLAAAGALRDPDVNHLVMSEFIKDVKQKLPEYLGL